MPLCQQHGDSTTGAFCVIRNSVVIFPPVVTKYIKIVRSDFPHCKLDTPVCLIIIPVCLFILDKSAGEYSYYFDHKFVSN